MAISKSYQISIVAGLIEEQLDPKHELLILSRKLDWEAIHQIVKSYYKLIGRNGKDSQLMVGLLILKHRLKLSDEQLVAGLRENVYWRTFCGLTGQLCIWRHESHLNSSSLTKFRQRMGGAGLRQIERCIQKQMMAEGFIDPSAMYIDTTAQEKNIAYPVDTNLLHKGQEKLRKGINKLMHMGLKLKKPRNFARKAKRAVITASKLGGNRKERIERSNKELILINRETQKSVRKALSAKNPRLKKTVQQRIQKAKDELKQTSELVDRVIEQTEQRMQDVHIPNKVLSLHEPQVVAIPKGKRAKPNEYGSKVAIASDNNGIVVAHEEYNHNVYDPKTMDSAVAGWEEVCGQKPDELAADRGFHTDELPEKVKEISTVAIPTKGNKPHRDHKKKKFKRLQRKRAAQEAVIAHLKRDHLMDRCRYKGFEGDQINVSLAVIAWNTKKWIRLEIEREEKTKRRSTMPKIA